MEEAMIAEKVTEIVKGIVQQKKNTREIGDLSENMNLISDIGLTSLDMAQLVSSLELEFGVDPFADGVTVADLRTLGNIVRVYGKYARNGGAVTAS
jgi:acyl carrier protein